MVLGGVAGGFVFVGLGSADESVAPELFPKQFFAQHCHACHAGPEPKGEFVAASLTQDFADEPNRRQWMSVREQLREGSMPPMDEPRPPVSEVEGLVEWIGQQVLQAERHVDDGVSFSAEAASGMATTLASIRRIPRRCAIST